MLVEAPEKAWGSGGEKPECALAQMWLVRRGAKAECQREYGLRGYQIRGGVGRRRLDLESILMLGALGVPMSCVKS